MNKQWCLYSALNNLIDSRLDAETIKKVQTLITKADIESMSRNELQNAVIDVLETHINKKS